jgi:hypothetical protein
MPTLLPLLLLLALAAQAQSPPPRMGQQRIDAPLDSADVIAWRQLTAGDFLSDHPPGPFATQAVRPVAVTCAYVVASPRARIFPTPVPGAPADSAFTATVENLSFHALMSRSCSWWNRETGVSPAYVLAHEQIHFDLFEVTARKLNRDFPGMLEVMDVRAGSLNGVVAATQAYVQQALNRALQETAKQNYAFDRETSFGFEPLRQEGWRRRLDRDLKELKEHAAPPEQVTPKAVGR